ncbi:MAG: BON domain-containing protein [Rhodoferax sp.]
MTTDTQLHTTVLDELKWRPSVNEAHIGVIAKDGVVMLTGQVAHYAKKAAAEEAAKGVYGVKGLANDITIKPEAKWIDVKIKIEDSFRRNADLEGRRISVSTDSGTVTLTGSVASWAERDQAVWAAWSAPGVTKVKSELAITP